jgi:hypothetical protein
MIKAEMLNNALYALHSILVRARFMAYTSANTQDIAVILDYAEALPRLIAVTDDMTQDFRQYIVDIVSRYPECSYILDRFDNSPAPETW